MKIPAKYNPYIARVFSRPVIHELATGGRSQVITGLLREVGLMDECLGLSVRLFFEKIYKHDNTFPGPGIIKIQAISSTNDLDGYSEFDLILVQDGY